MKLTSVTSVLLVAANALADSASLSTTTSSIISSICLTLSLGYANDTTVTSKSTVTLTETIDDVSTSYVTGVTSPASSALSSSDAESIKTLYTPTTTTVTINYCSDDHCSSKVVTTGVIGVTSTIDGTMTVSYSYCPLPSPAVEPETQPTPAAAANNGANVAPNNGENVAPNNGANVTPNNGPYSPVAASSAVRPDLNPQSILSAAAVSLTPMALFIPAIFMLA